VSHYKLDGKNDQCQYKKKYADPVDAMHVFYEKRFRPVGIRFPDVEILCKLLPHTHEAKIRMSDE